MDAISGILQGTITLKARVEAAVFCYYEEPVNTPCGVVGAYDGTVVCFTIENCKEIWKINIKSMIKSKATCCNGLVYIASYDGKIRGIDVLVSDAYNIFDDPYSALGSAQVLTQGLRVRFPHQYK